MNRNSEKCADLQAALLVVPLTALRAADAPQSKRPNIVLILIDDQGYGDIGPFGAKGYSTPNLDRMASEGRKFTSFHVPQPACSASRAGLLTGCYPNRIGIHGALGPSAMHGIADTEMTLAELVKQQGYATGMAGKWHLGTPKQFLPLQHGFDEYFGLPYSNDMWPYQFTPATMAPGSATATMRAARGRYGKGKGHAGKEASASRP